MRKGEEVAHGNCAFNHRDQHQQCSDRTNVGCFRSDVDICAPLTSFSISHFDAQF